MGRKSSLCPDFAPELVNDLKNLTAISQETEDLLLELMNERVKFRCGRVYQTRLEPTLPQNTRNRKRQK